MQHPLKLRNLTRPNPLPIQSDPRAHIHRPEIQSANPRTNGHAALATPVNLHLLLGGVLLEDVVRVVGHGDTLEGVNCVQGEGRAVEVLADCAVAVVGTDGGAVEGDGGLFAETGGFEDAFGGYLGHDGSCRFDGWCGEDVGTFLPINQSR